MTPAASSLPNQAGSSFAPQTGQPGPVAHGRPSGGIHQGGQSAPYSLNEILALLGVAGYKGQAQANMAAIAMAESGGDPNATHTNADGSVDRGLFQINNVAHPGVSDACAFDPVCSAHQAAAIEKSSGWGAWSTWTNGSASHWLTQAESAQKAGKWKTFKSEFAGDRLGQANAGRGAAGSASTQALVDSKNGMLFNCKGGSISTFGPIVTGGSLPDIGCYMESAFVFTMYAVGGLILVGAGVLLLAHKNPLAVGLKGVAMTPVGRLAGAGKATGTLTAAGEQRERRLAFEQQVEARRQRTASSKLTPTGRPRRSSQDQLNAAKAALFREQARTVKKNRTEGPNILRPVSILGQPVPKFDVPGMDDPTRMAG